MAMNTHGFEEYWQSSLPIPMHDPSSLGHLAQTPTSKCLSFTPLLSPCLKPHVPLFAEPIGYQAERTPGRHEQHATEFPCGWNMSPTQELPASMEEREISSPEIAPVDPTGWYPHYTACLQHFVNHSQHSLAVQSMAALINIRLPCQRASSSQSSSSLVSLQPYIRRLIVTGQDTASVLHAFFGDDWVAGVGCLCKEERLNYLFTAKSSGWAGTKQAYDIQPDELVPVLRPLREATEEELRTAEARWSEWLAMEDWMVGPRSPW